MTESTINTSRRDPYENFKFRVKWDGQYQTGFTEVSGLTSDTDVIDYREGGDPSTSRKLPGLTKYAPITLKRGLTGDTAFEDWANKVNNFQGDAAMSLATFRKDIAIEVFNPQGTKVLAYNVFRAWVSEYQALPQLDAGGNAVMITTIKIENEGWVRDTSVTEQKET